MEAKIFAFSELFDDAFKFKSELSTFLNQIEMSTFNYSMTQNPFLKLEEFDPKRLKRV